MIKFAIRHKATGILMPFAKKDSGYSHWNPDRVPAPGDHYSTIAGNGMSNAIPGSVRLFETVGKARYCIREWSKGEQKWGDATWDEPHGDCTRVAYIDKRPMSVLEIVPVRLLLGEPL